MLLLKVSALTGFAAGAILAPICPTNTSLACLLNGSANLTMLSQLTSNTLDASTKQIEGIMSPQTSTSEMLNHLTRVNLSHNLLSTIDDVLRLPPWIETLDLSYNKFNALVRVNWSALFPNLATLYVTTPQLKSRNWPHRRQHRILRGNNISTVQDNSFPPSLAILDLSENPLAQMILNRATFDQLSAPTVTFTFHTLRQKADIVLSPDVAAANAACGANALEYMENNVVCVSSSPAAATPNNPIVGSFSRSPVRLTDHAFVAFLVRYVVVALAIIFGVMAVAAFLVKHARARFVLGYSDGRETIISSVYDQDDVANLDDIIDEMEAADHIEVVTPTTTIPPPTPKEPNASSRRAAA
ncbi:Aste57867_1919 [Aphanomyces stellatus]|uniref:Aste57867_1919 protein n=1 Tax=Aphanomyces stellatus TaxID=120398 RepID=A0A485K696_9STRA|nr:hypothetical protein As57867_001917 [Aphanomyces stellatus]VFT79124.1 Aste57867_1919 [Aphanomyces stellatus]